MEVSAIAAVQSADFLPTSAIQPTTVASASSSFSDMVSQGISKVNDQLLTSQADLQALASGDVQNLHQVMMRLEESRLSFQLMVQVRNRLLESYQEVMKMQI